MSGNHKHTTLPEDMASSHRRYAGWIERIRKDAATIGPATAALCNLILDERWHPEQGFRACLGIIRLARSYGQQRLDGACHAGDRYRHANLRFGQIDPRQQS